LALELRLECRRGTHRDDVAVLVGRQRYASRPPLGIEARRGQLNVDGSFRRRHATPRPSRPCRGGASSPTANPRTLERSTALPSNSAPPDWRQAPVEAAPSAKSVREAENP